MMTVLLLPVLGNSVLLPVKASVVDLLLVSMASAVGNGLSMTAVASGSRSVAKLLSMWLGLLMVRLLMVGLWLVVLLLLSVVLLAGNGGDNQGGEHQDNH
uniref:(northern house mosquito) hypothetical protein n=1 Tax=Culex pipiens TaxID=7175 RepID=A0A8D8ACG0_CULPI